MATIITRILLLMVLIGLALSAAPSALGSDDDASLTAALAERSKDRIRQLGALGADSPEGPPYRRVDGTSGFASVVLPDRDEPYSLSEIVAAFPESFTIQDGGELLVKDDLIVGEGATLSIDSSMVTTIRLLSTASRFVTITSWRGTITISGTELEPIRIYSWDPENKAVDSNLVDGRAWIHTRRGSMSLKWVEATYLGFATGSLSGIAWEGRPEDPSRGNVSNSTFQYNYFGAYTFEAVSMVWRFNTFSHNVGYGFDPHDHSNYFVFEYNVAEFNGTHGIIFSRGCNFNTIQFNRSSNNGQHGIVLDDGPNLNPDGTIRDRPGIASDSNIIQYNVVFGNDVGIVLDGGTSNVIARNVVSYNNIGVRMKDAVVGNRIERNTFLNNDAIGVYLYNGSDSNLVTDNSFRGGMFAIELKDSRSNQIARNEMNDLTSSALYLVGDVTDTVVTGNLAEHVITPLKHAGSIGSVIYSGNNFAPDKGPSSQWSIMASAKRGLIWSVLLLFPLLGWPYVSKAVKFVRNRSSRLFRSA